MRGLFQFGLILVLTIVVANGGTTPTPTPGCTNDTWSPISDVGAPGVTGNTVWTGTEMIVWNGTGGRYNPSTDTWTPISTVGAPTQGGPAIWTGTEMIVWGGGNALNTGGRYNPDH